MGDVALTASNLALSINMIAFLPMIGIGIAASMLVGKYQGQKSSEFAERAGWTALCIALDVHVRNRTVLPPDADAILRLVCQ